jgi:hypothetical protein
VVDVLPLADNQAVDDPPTPPSEVLEVEGGHLLARYAHDYGFTTPVSGDLLQLTRYYGYPHPSQAGQVALGWIAAQTLLPFGS